MECLDRGRAYWPIWWRSSGWSGRHQEPGRRQTAGSGQWSNSGAACSCLPLGWRQHLEPAHNHPLSLHVLRRYDLVLLARLAYLCCAATPLTTSTKLLEQFLHRNVE